MTADSKNQNNDTYFAAPQTAVKQQAAVTPSLSVSSGQGAQGAEAPTPQAENTIKVGRTTYAVGLFWQPLQDVDDPIPEIRETMESDTGTNLYAIHYGRAPQYAIGRTDKGHKEGQVVGGIAVLDALSDKYSFVAVFKVPEGWWFLVARNDLILPEEDILYHTEQEAKDAFFSMMAVPDWGYKIAPASWNLDDTEEMDLTDLLKRGQQVRLQSLSAIRGTKILLTFAILIFIIIAIIAYSVFFFIDKEKKEAPVIEPVAPQVSLQTVEPQRVEEKPWDKLVSVPDFLTRCWSSSYQLKAMQIPGWGLNQIVCTPQGIATGWTKTWTQGGRVAWVEVGIKEQYRFKGEAQINETGTATTITFSFDNIPQVVSKPTLSLAQIRRELTDISQALSLPITMTNGQVSGPTPPPPAPGQPAQPAKVYQYLTFSFTSSMDPPAWESFFSKFAGLEITRIQYNPRSESALTNNWTYEGRIYEKEK